MTKLTCLLFAATLLLGCRGDRSTGIEIAQPASTKVSTGLVNWHAGGLQAARLASKESGRPVLLFELFGELDQAFC